MTDLTWTDEPPTKIVNALPPSHVKTALLANGEWTENWDTMQEELVCTVNSMGSPTRVVLGGVALTATKQKDRSVERGLKRRVFNDALDRHPIPEPELNQ